MISSYFILTQDFPFKVGRRHPVEYERQFPHLRARTQMFSALSRVRSEASRAIHEYFQVRSFTKKDHHLKEIIRIVKSIIIFVWIYQLPSWLTFTVM